MPYTPTQVLPELDLIDTSITMSGNSEMRKKQYPLNCRPSLFGKNNNNANINIERANNFNFPDGGWVCC